MGGPGLARGTRTARWADPGSREGRGRRGGRTRARKLLTTRMGIRKRETKALGRRRLRIERTPPLDPASTLFISRVAPDEESDDGCEERQGRDEGGDRGRVSVCVADAVRRFGSRFRVHPPQSGFPANFAYASPKTKHKNAVAAMEGESWRRFAERSGERGRRRARARGTESRRAERRKDSCTGREGKGVIFRFFQMGRHAPVMRRWRRRSRG